MNQPETDPAAGSLGTPQASPEAAEPPDAVLLQRFVASRDEQAFSLLVQRYGPLVLGVCLRVLEHRQDAEDAFLVLARKAGSIVRGGSLPAWLCRVASRISQKARKARGKRAMPENPLPDVPAPDETPQQEWRDLRPILNEEVNRLPLKYRLPVILCYLEGKTNAQAAAQLHCPPGTVMSRLAWARERLRSRLARRGVTLSATAVVAALGQSAGAISPPAVLAAATVANALRFVGGGPVPPQVAGPAEAFLRAVFRSRLRQAGAALLVLAVVVLLAVWTWNGGRWPGRAQAPAPNPALAPTDWDRIQGVWIPDEISFAGNAQPVAGLRLAFVGREFRLSAGGPETHWQFTLLPDQDPKGFVLDLGNNQVFHGIYRLDGDVLLIRYAVQGEQTPTDFVSMPPVKTAYYRLHRQPPTPEGENSGQ